MHQEKRKWQSEMENKKRQLEDDRRALQHLKVRTDGSVNGRSQVQSLDHKITMLFTSDHMTHRDKLDLACSVV